MKDLLVDVKFSLNDGRALFSQSLPDRNVVFWDPERPQNLDWDSILYGLLWKPDIAVLQGLERAKILFSAGAGVDHLLTGDRASYLPKDVPIVRFVDPTLTQRMSEWVCLQCLSHLRRSMEYARFQSNAMWQELQTPLARQVNVGVMGLGELGRDAALKLRALGFNVLGWSRTKKALENVKTFDADHLEPFLNQCDMIVGLLPLTEQTQGLFSYPLFKKLRQGVLPHGPVFINAGRGGSQREEDVLRALDDGILGGVSLDVFEHEPLSGDNPLWHHDKAILTPHNASVSDSRALAAYIGNQIHRFEEGKPLENVVEIDRQY